MSDRVVIIGAGVGGITLALLLRQRGIIAEVLEQSAELREVGAAISLAANATRVLEQLGLARAWRRYRPSPPGSSIATAATAVRSLPPGMASGTGIRSARRFSVCTG